MKTRKFMLNSDGLVVVQVSDTTTTGQLVAVEEIDQELERNEMIIKTLETRNSELKADKKEIDSLISGGKKKVK
ncbi:MAG: hypothetical protein WAZ19_09060 [Anaerolineae bacterium]